MSSPITLSGFNNIDFNALLNAVMAQESLPLTNLQTQQTTLNAKASSYRTLATKLAAFQSAADALSDPGGATGSSVTVTDPSAVSVSASGTATPGLFDIIIQKLARAQVTTSTSTAPDADTTIVASGGSLQIGSVLVPITGDETLRDLADKINQTPGIGVSATVIRASEGHYQLVLTGRATGAAGSFTITNALTGGVGVSFADTDSDGVSGNSEADNAVQASDAAALVNNVLVTSATNTLDGAIPGASITLLKQTADTVTASVAQDLSPTKDKLKAVADAYNDLVTFADQQSTAARNGDQSSLSRDGVLSGLRTSLRQVLSGQYNAGGTLTSLGQIGLEFDRNGHLSFNSATFDTATTGAVDELSQLFSGTTDAAGSFKALSDAVDNYTKAGGLIDSTQDRLSQQLSGLGSRISDFQARLDIRRQALQQEYTATDSLISQLNSQASSLSQIGNEYRLY